MSELDFDAYYQDADTDEQTADSSSAHLFSLLTPEESSERIKQAQKLIDNFDY